MARRTANAKPRAARLIQPRAAKKLEDQQIQPRNVKKLEDQLTQHRIARSQGIGLTNRAKERAAHGQTFLMPRSGTTSRPQMQRPAPLHQPRALHRTQHHALHSNRRSTRHSHRATSMWVGPPSTPMKKASPRARHSKHSTGPHLPPLGWAYPPPAPPRDPSPHRPATLRASRHVHSEVRWIKARDGSRRPVFQSHTGKICCAIECGNPSCRFERLPCNKPLHSPASDDVHILHRCSKCKELED